MTDEAPQALHMDCTFSDDRASVRITIPADPPIALTLNAGGVEMLMHGLSQVRAEMQPEVPRDWQGGPMARGIRDPRFVCDREVLHGGTLLRIRHPGLGWLHFSFPPEVARSLGAFLLEQAKRARQPRPSENRN